MRWYVLINGFKWICRDLDQAIKMHRMFSLGGQYPILGHGLDD
jgi:hypothetical protein